MPFDFIYLRAWCRLLGSNGDYTKQQLERARSTNAPPNALYERYDHNGPTGQWALFDRNHYGTMSSDTHSKVVELADRIMGARR